MVKKISRKEKKDEECGIKGDSLFIYEHDWEEGEDKNPAL